MLILESNKFFLQVCMEFVKMKFWKVFDFVLFGTLGLMAVGLSIAAVYSFLQGFWKGVFGAVFWIVVIIFSILWHYRPAETLNGSDAKPKDP